MMTNHLREVVLSIPLLSILTCTVWRAVTPVVTCKSHEYSAYIGYNVTVTCTVSANPSSQVTWSAVVQSRDDFYSVLDDASVSTTSTVKRLCSIILPSKKSLKILEITRWHGSARVF